ncbi:NADP-dependent oxidoreductase [Candidatus Poriferisodalis sp.]|uniref:NADP-dependent oxidoreductase n=1 Tax=Candidatus Poriferisodalis sp. TaxID=3101277 RepID=UPI003B01E6AE
MTDATGSGRVSDCVVLATVPDGPLDTEHFALQTEEVPEPGPGEVLVRVQAITIGAGQRAGLQGSASYAGAPQAGVVMGGTGAGVVEASNAASISVGDTVVGRTGWRRHAVLRADEVHVADSDLDPAVHLGVLGNNGLTAYFGLLDVGRPESGETVVVSAAAGSVGHIVGQIAKAQGCRVVGVAGSEEKCALLVDEIGFDVAINRHSPDFRAEFRAATPDRINVYFDNTGGEILGSALFRMATFGRIVCCGAVSAYDTASPDPSPRGLPGLLVNNQVRMQGFIVFSYADRYDEARAQMRAWIDAGSLVPRHVTYEGLESAGGAFVDLLGGRTVGTTIVRLGD